MTQILISPEDKVSLSIHDLPLDHILWKLIKKQKRSKLSNGTISGTITAGNIEIRLFYMEGVK